MGWVLYHVKRFWMIRVSGLHFIPHLRSPWLTGELTRPANVRLENESQSGPQVDRHSSMPDRRLICGASDCRREDAEQFNTETRRGSNGLETRVGVERLVECQYINQPVGALFIPYRHNFP